MGFLRNRKIHKPKNAREKSYTESNATTAVQSISARHLAPEEREPENTREPSAPLIETPFCRNMNNRQDATLNLIMSQF